ncbi:hypothetical protein D8674_008649 [Pyrus ussuriensis x Pyrus communis]|uniref:Uncharacterized protein n=1 Tax=Pyrus ussuriensis x Pyrus communis TaxID=2448454 RepID=A0A5N5I0A8_9ROSA|nr:hypothetical protein D8674_008649 [Pyrus ussuriensis x Pyrus communis]
MLFIAFSSTFQELSKQNANNRKKLKYHHKGGARPFIQHARTTHKKGDSLLAIDNWGAFHKDKNGQWINDVAREKYIPYMCHWMMSLESWLKTLRRKGKSINGVGVFPRTDTFGCISSMTSSSELIDIRSQIKLLLDGFLKMQQENEQLRAQLDLHNDDENLFTKIKAFIAASQEKTNNSTESDGDISKGENTYPVLEEHDLEEE